MSQLWNSVDVDIDKIFRKIFKLMQSSVRFELK
jgi:hypothetical protein